MNNTTIDRKTLAWIKEGVDETLQHVQRALTEFTENSDDVTPIKTCIGALHRVKGAVQMVGIEGARILAEEMEMLAFELVGKRIKLKIEAAEVLAAGMYQMTGYLESLYHGQPDLPLVLLPILNDCRACQDKELYSEGEFFTPDLSISAPLKAARKCAVSGNTSTVAKKLRPGYLSGLLGVIKKNNEAQNIKKLVFVLENLLIASNNSKAQQLWWISLGIAESLQDRGLEPSIAVKILLGRIDRQIHRVITMGEKAISDEPPTKVIKNLLYYISQSQSYGNNVVEIKKAFELDYPDDTEINNARETLYGYNVNMVDSISDQLNEELTTIKCELDIAKHSNAGSTDGLGKVLKNFSSIADILNMLGMSKQNDLLNEQKEFLSRKISSNQILSDDDLMGMATALLYVESSISDLAGAMHQTDDTDGIPPAEYEKLLKLVAKELLSVIQSIKGAIDEYSNGPSNISHLANVPDLLTRISGTMQAINDEQQSSLANAINQYISQDLILKGSPASMVSLDLLADAITGLENYYQALIEESVAPELGLRVASQSITKLGFPPEQDYPVLSSYNYVA